MIDKRKFYINGQWIDPIKKNDLEVINPCNEDPFAVISLPGVAQRAATGLRNLRTPVPASGGMLGRAGSLAGGAARGAGSIVKRIPILGSLISAGFGALDANTEEMERLRAENPGMSDEQINAGLADGSLKKDKAKIIGRSAGAGAGAGVGTVVGGILGSALGPIGTAVGAAAGAWLGENVGKFLGEGFANTFKSFDWGKTFGPVITSFKELAGSITGALDTVAGAFGITGDGEGGSGGFIQALKNIGRIIGVVAKILMKVLAPALQIVAKTIKGVVDVISAVIGGISAFIKGAFGMVKNIINNPIARAIPGVAGIADMISGAESMFSGDVIGNISNFVDGVDTSLPNTEAGNGMGGGFNLLNPLSWFSGKSQKAIESKDKDFSNKTLSGSLLNRTQSDRSLYRKFMQEKLVNYCNLSIFSDPVIEFIFSNNGISGFLAQKGNKVSCNKLILTTGTFLNGLIHIGDERTPAG